MTEDPLIERCDEILNEISKRDDQDKEEQDFSLGMIFGIANGIKMELERRLEAQPKHPADQLVKSVMGILGTDPGQPKEEQRPSGPDKLFLERLEACIERRTNVEPRGERWFYWVIQSAIRKHRIQDAEWAEAYLENAEVTCGIRRGAS